MRSFFAACPELLFVAGLDGELRLCSDKMRDTLGLVPDQQTSLSAIVHPEDQDALTATLARLRRDPDPVQIDVRLRNRVGTYVSMSYSARRSAEGDAIYGSLRPSSEATSAEGIRARLKSKLLDCIADQVDMGVWAIDTSGVFVYHDGKGVEQAGVKRGQFLGLNIRDVYAGYGEMLETMRRALSGEEIHSYAEAHDMHWESWFAPVRDSAGRVELVAGLTLNITELRKAEESARVKLRQIEKQQEVIRNLTTPIIEVWDGVLTLPMVGFVDSMGTAKVMDALLTRIVEQHARYAILDLTGLDLVDTMVAGHIVRLVTAIRLLGAEGVVAGIKPSVAQTMVSLGLDMSQIPTQRNLRAALAYCIERMGQGKKPAARR